MDSFKDHRKPSHRRFERSEKRNRRTPDESTGAEADYLRSLVDSRSEVTVVLENGDQLRGRVRYCDLNCFSIQLADRGLNVFLRKSSVLYIYEE